jgi:uncharacterized membrane protein
MPLEVFVESRFKFLGHPIHPVLVVFPVALLVTAAALDLLTWWQGAFHYAAVAHLNMGIGVAIGIIAMAFGWLDWLAIPERTRAKRIGAIHGVLNMVALALFALTWAQRQGTADLAISATWLTVEVAALLILAVGGWLGGELVDRLAVGVDVDAHLNASNSLSGSRGKERRSAA